MATILIVVKQMNFNPFCTSVPLNPFPPSFAFHIGTSHLVYLTNK